MSKKICKLCSCDWENETNIKELKKCPECLEYVRAVVTDAFSHGKLRANW